jgi:hypothetical protein
MDKTGCAELQSRVMAATIEIKVPDILARALGGEGGELPRRTLEAATLQQYAAGKITHAEVGEILGLDRWETDALLKRREVFPPDFESEFQDDLKQLRQVLGE